MVVMNFRYLALKLREKILSGCGGVNELQPVSQYPTRAGRKLKSREGRVISYLAPPFLESHLTSDHQDHFPR